MRTVADFISARAALRVTCRNCGHEHYFKARFLKARLGFTGNVFDAPFSCSRCKGTTVSLAAAAEPAAERPVGRMAYFDGVYSKHED